MLVPLEKPSRDVNFAYGDFDWMQNYNKNMQGIYRSAEDLANELKKALQVATILAQKAETYQKAVDGEYRAYLNSKPEDKEEMKNMAAYHLQTIRLCEKYKSNGQHTAQIIENEIRMLKQKP